MIVQRLLSWSKFFLDADLLAHHRVGDGGFQRPDPLPSACRPDLAMLTPRLNGFKLPPSTPSMPDFIGRGRLRIVKTIVAGT